MPANIYSVSVASREQTDKHSLQLGEEGDTIWRGENCRQDQVLEAMARARSRHSTACSPVHVCKCVYVCARVGALFVCVCVGIVCMFAGIVSACLPL